MTKTLIFVYGTLKRGLSNHGWLRGQSFVDVARTQPCYRIFDLGGYPGMVEAEDGVSVEGEVWEVDAEGLQGLDVLEGVAEGEYAFGSVALIPPWDQSGVGGYLYLRSVAGCRDCGVRWEEGLIFPEETSQTS
jgi:gamma-glutamylcyclotransferase (GGCT)/AIG2-like uncharacterized protein YtfP